MGYLELTAVVFGFLYLILIIYKKPVAWFFGIISAALFWYLWKFSKEPHPQILIIVPTRELVTQIVSEIEKLRAEAFRIN